MNSASSSIYSISTVSNLDTLLLRSFRLIPGNMVEFTIPPYFDVISKETLLFIPTIPTESASNKGYGYFIKCTVADGLPYLVFNAMSVSRLLAHVHSLELRDSGFVLWSDSDRLDSAISVDVYWIRKPDNTWVQDFQHKLNLLWELHEQTRSSQNEI